MFRSKKHHVLYAIRHQGRTTEAIHSSSRLLAQQKVAALKLFFFGLFLIPLWGAGLVLWIWGLRLLAVGLPTGPMQQELKRALPTPS